MADIDSKVVTQVKSKSALEKAEQAKKELEEQALNSEPDQLKNLKMKISTDHRGIISTEDFEEPEEIYHRLIHRVRMYHPNTDISMIEKAYHFARQAHGEQKRKSGEPYIIHPLSVALILSDLELDKETIVAGLLHDVVEDTPVTIEDVTREFSAEVALLVDGVTKLGQLDYDKDKVEVQAENLRKMFLAMAKDIRVILIKLADRLHNMRTLQYMRPEKQIEKSRETQEIYAPLAQRLGISKIKVELDDLSLKYLEPKAYQELVHEIDLRWSEREGYVEKLIDEVKKAVADGGIDATIMGRAKHIFSIYKKMKNQHKTLDQIYDLFAVRIIVNDIRDCYGALGIIHEKYTPIPGRFKDYIAMPKPNMYQSLHTTVIGPDGQPFEVQIRTYEMHRTSEYGIAAHWKYKESGEGSTINNEEAKLSWLRQILEWQQDMSDNREFMSLLKSDLNLFSDTVFCFTPSGDVKNLPKGSTPIDFAYAIHSAVGNRMVGAKVNGRLVPLDYEIKNGDRIEVLTSQNSKGPSTDWLKIVHSTQAKNKINQWFRAQEKTENIQRGRELLMDKAHEKGIDWSKLDIANYREVVLRRYGFHDWDALLATVGHGGLTENRVISRMIQEYEKDHPLVQTDEDVLRNVNQTEGDAASGEGSVQKPAQPRERKHSTNGVRIKGMPDLPVHFSKCCNPVPGDEIIGYITRGRGITIHRTDCVNIMNIPEIEKARLIDCEWEEAVLDNKTDETFDVTLRVFANNRTGLLVDLSKIFTEQNIDIQYINTRISKSGIATIELKFAIKTRQELSQMIARIRQVDSVIDIQRTRG
jgi:guanosine-3',5'-bis(diphosphate) 3'-pyrophosphohydrolase